MNTPESFSAHIAGGYTFAGDAILLGAGMLDGETFPDAPVRVPLGTLNRHGLIAGATGTGKTKTLQKLAEGLSSAGTPVLLMDVKGDLGGLAHPGLPNPHIDRRHAAIGQPWKPVAFPVEFLSISEEPGTRLRATVSEFGPVLLSKILGINETQSGVVSVVFKYCDDHRLPLLDLKDLKKTLQYVTGDGKSEFENEYGRVSTATTGSILRKIVEIEQEGADLFFGERSFDVEDLMAIDDQGRGAINILQLGDIQGKPRMFSTFMLCLLAEVYATLPETGDTGQPALVIFLDEAHLLFQEASRTLLEQIETIVKLIRSKGVGIVFCTQQPTDIPPGVLSQLGMKIQHALRAFTAQDRKALKATAENYPLSPFYTTDELLTSLGTGEALITVLNDRGAPTPLVHTMLCAPESQMGPLTQAEVLATVDRSRLAAKYRENIDRESAYEILTAKIADTRTAPSAPGAGRGPSHPVGTTSIGQMMNNPVARQVGTVVARELTRGLLGVLGLGSTRRTRRTRLF